MSEREYIEHIRKTAAAYLAAIEQDNTAQAFLYGPEVRAWQNTKEFLSPSTAIVLCDAWLALASADQQA